MAKGIGGAAALEIGEEGLRPGVEPAGPLGPVEPRVEVVDDVVGVAGEPVEGVDIGAFGGRQQPGREEVGPPVLGIEPPGHGVAGLQLGVADAGGAQFAPGTAARLRAAGLPAVGDGGLRTGKRSGNRHGNVRHLILLAAIGGHDDVPALTSGPSPSPQSVEDPGRHRLQVCQGIGQRLAAEQPGAQFGSYHGLGRQVLGSRQFGCQQRCVRIQGIGQGVGECLPAQQLEVLLAALQIGAVDHGGVEAGHLIGIGRGAPCRQLEQDLLLQREHQRGAGRAAAHRLDQRVAQRMDLVEEQVLLGVEVVEHRGRRDTGLPGDVGNGHGVEAAFEEQRHRGGVDRPAGPALVLLAQAEAARRGTARGCRGGHGATVR